MSNKLLCHSCSTRTVDDVLQELHDIKKQWQRAKRDLKTARQRISKLKNQKNKLLLDKKKAQFKPRPISFFKSN